MPRCAVRRAHGRGAGAAGAGTGRALSPAGPRRRVADRTLMSESFVIVGANLAGGTAAATLREEGFGGRVVLIGAEPQLPYERPPLSKQYLRGEVPLEKAFLRPPEFYRERDIETRLGMRVVAVDSGARAVELSSGERIAYDRLLVATGGRNRRVPIPGLDLAGVYDLRTVADADRIRAEIAPGRKAAWWGRGSSARRWRPPSASAASASWSSSRSGRPSSASWAKRSAASWRRSTAITGWTCSSVTPSPRLKVLDAWSASSPRAAAGSSAILRWSAWALSRPRRSWPARASRSTTGSWWTSTAGRMCPGSSRLATWPTTSTRYSADTCASSTGRTRSGRALRRRAACSVWGRRTRRCTGSGPISTTRTCSMPVTTPRGTSSSSAAAWQPTNSWRSI